MDQIHHRWVICCDGTWNNSDGAEDASTNVTRFSRSVNPFGTGIDGKMYSQVVYYLSGIGTGTSWLSNAIEGATGRGVSELIRKAYHFLCSNYQTGDEIFLIGFSRGAFIARSIASVIRSIGLLTRQGLDDFHNILTQWENGTFEDRGGLRKGAIDPESDSEINKLRRQLEKGDLTQRNIPIKAVAVWDTVGSLGIPRLFLLPQPVSRQLAFVNTKIPANVEFAFHALALDERRRNFAPTLWQKDDNEPLPRVLKQCWFPGEHSDVGGGNGQFNFDSLVPLIWMTSQLEPLLSIDLSCFGQLLKAHKEALESMKNKPVDKNTIKKALPQNTNGGIFMLGGYIPRTPGEFRQLDEVTLKLTDKPLRNTCETIHWSLRVRMILNASTFHPKKETFDSPALRDFAILATPSEAEEPTSQKKIVWIRKKTGVRLPEEPIAAAEEILTWILVPELGGAAVASGIMSSREEESAHGSRSASPDPQGEPIQSST